MSHPKGLLDHEQLLDISAKSGDDMEDRVKELAREGITGSDAYANVVAGYGLTPEAAAMFTAWISDRAGEHDVEIEVLAGVALTALAVGSEAGLGGRLLRAILYEQAAHGDVFFGVGPQTKNDGTADANGGWLARMLIGREAPDSPMAGGEALGAKDTLEDTIGQMLGDVRG